LCVCVQVCVCVHPELRAPHTLPAAFRYPLGTLTGHPAEA